MILFDPSKKQSKPVFAVAAVYRYDTDGEDLEAQEFSVVDFYGLIRADSREDALTEALNCLPLGLDRWVPESKRGQRRLLVTRVNDLGAWRYRPDRMRQVEFRGITFNVCY